jgi:hypothetical protein
MHFSVEEAGRVGEEIGIEWSTAPFAVEARRALSWPRQLHRGRDSGYSESGVWLPACACSAESRTVSSRAWTRTCAPEPTPKVQ